MVVMFKVEKNSLAIQHFPDVRQIEIGLAFLQNMTSGDYLPNSETLCLWEIYFQLWQGSCWLRKFMTDLCLKFYFQLGFDGLLLTGKQFCKRDSGIAEFIWPSFLLIKLWIPSDFVFTQCKKITRPCCSFQNCKNFFGVSWEEEKLKGIFV